MKKAIINFANGRYMIGQERLKKSLIEHGFDGDFIGWQNENQIGSPPHKANPYAFKTHGFQKAFDQGYDMVVWLDASVVAVADIQPMWDKIESQGYIMQEAGHLCSTWCNDASLQHFGITRDKAQHFPMYGNAGFLGLNRHNEKAMDFFNQWHNASKIGAFIGSWDNKNNSESRDTRCKGHRHDMSCGSIIANQLKMKMESGNEWLHYAPPTQQPKTNVIFHAQGV
jgi:hypothetical protein